MNACRWVPSREQLLASRWLRPVARHLEDDGLWHMNRQSVARAAAIGLFFGLMLPFAQFLFAVLTAIVLRANVPLSAAFTLITNPLTFGPVYWLAHRVGSGLLGGSTPPEAGQQAVAEMEVLHEALGGVEVMWQWVLEAGAPLLLGLATMACVASVTGYLLVWLLWRHKDAHKASHRDVDAP